MRPACEGCARAASAPAGREPTSAELTRTGLFVAEDISTYRWSITLDEEQVRRLFTTFSDWNAEEVDGAAEAVRDLGGRVVEHYTSLLIVMRPADRG